MPPVKIHVSCCGGCDYNKKVNALKQSLLKKFSPDQFQLEAECGTTTPGCFEVTVNGKLVHSKKNGDGYVDTDEKLAKIFNAVRKSLES